MSTNRPERRLLGPALAALLVWGISAPGSADTDYTEFELGELVAMDVVYGASRYQQKLTDAPASVTVITDEEIEAFGYRSLGDVLASVRGFWVTYDRSYEYVGVRGFGRPGDYNTRVLVLIDGHAANEIVYGQASISRELALDLDQVERVEVIRGPGSVLYGAGAFFAVINIVTRCGGDSGGSEAMVETGSLGSAGGRAAWGRSLGERSELLVTASGFRMRGEDLYWPEYDDPATNNGVFVDGDGESVLHLSSRWRQGGLAAAVGYADRRKRVPTGEWDMLFNDRAARLRDERLFADLAYTRDPAAPLGLRAHLAADLYRYQGDYPLDYAAPGEERLRVVSHDFAEGCWLAGDAQVSRGDRHRLVAGGDFRKALRVHQKYWDADATYLDLDQRVDNVGVFVQNEIRLRESATLAAGLRVDGYTSFGGLATPRLGLIVHPRPSSTGKLLYGEAYRAPNAYELYYDDETSAKGNPDLAPEHIRTGELVLEQSFGTHVTGSLSVFRNDISDLIEQIVDPADSLLIFANTGEVRTTGVEVEIDARLLPGWRGRAGYSYQHTEDAKTDEGLTNSPAHIFQANLSTPRFAERACAHLELRRVSRRSTLAGGSVPPYGVLDLAVDVHLGHNLGLSATVDNLFDTAYADPGAEHQLQDALAREGRRFGLRLGYRR